MRRCTGKDCPHRDSCSRYVGNAPNNRPRSNLMVPPSGVAGGGFCAAFIAANCFGSGCLVRPEDKEKDFVESRQNGE
jgi:hypothetical protein